MAAEYRQRLNLLRPKERFSLEGDALVRRAGGGVETRWPLAELIEARLARHPLTPQLSRQMLQLRFRGRRRASLTSHSLAGVGRFQDDSSAFRAFAGELLVRARRCAPEARLVRGGPAGASSLWLLIAALALGALVMVASAIAGGAAALGLDLGARMVFLLLLAACVLPWLDRGAGGRLTPEELLAG